MGRFDNLSGQTFGTWKVLAFDHMEYHGVNHKSGMSYYLCECKTCGEHKLVSRSQLLRQPCKRHGKYWKCGVN